VVLKKPWTQKEIEMLVKLYGRIKIKEISATLKRTPHAIRNKASRLKLRGYRLPPITKICILCGKEFTVLNAFKNRRYCSKECALKETNRKRLLLRGPIVGERNPMYGRKHSLFAREKMRIKALLRYNKEVVEC
jgi:hypothetical protein